LRLAAVVTHKESPVATSILATWLPSAEPTQNAGITAGGGTKTLVVVVVAGSVVVGSVVVGSVVVGSVVVGSVVAGSVVTVVAGSVVGVATVGVVNVDEPPTAPAPHAIRPIANANPATSLAGGAAVTGGS